jgi:C-terminal processing protease CtpA/Prc
MKIIFTVLLLASTAHADFRIISFNKESIYAKLGLKEGDVVVSINGKPANNKQDMMALDDLIKKGEKFEIELMRDSETKIFTYDAQKKKK